MFFFCAQSKASRIIVRSLSYTGLDIFHIRKNGTFSMKLMTCEEVASQLGCTKQTVSALIRSKELAGTRVGNQWVVESDALNEYIHSNNLSKAPNDHKRKNDSIPGIIGLSFFSGALGLDLGLERAGITSLLYCEVDKRCRMTIDSARPDAALIGDITKYSAEEILEYARVPQGTDVDVMFGGPPCQAFSTAGARRAFADERGNVFLRYLELAEQIRPRYLVIENVRGLLSAKWPIEEQGEAVRGGVMSKILQILTNMNYSISFELYNAANFGAPQSRERVVLIAKRDGARPVEHLVPTHSTNGAFGLSPWVTFGEATEGIKTVHSSQFPEKRLKYLRMLGEGQYWKDLPEDLIQEAMGKSYSLPGGKTGFYRRIRRDRACPTLVTSPTMPATDLCHPTEDRPLSIEEYKRVQGFPDDWPIRGSIQEQYKQIGNAVPVALGKAIGKAIIADMNGEHPQPPEGFRFSRYTRTSERTWEDPRDRQSSE